MGRSFYGEPGERLVCITVHCEAVCMEAEGTALPDEVDTCSPPAPIYCCLLLSPVMVTNSSSMPGLYRLYLGLSAR